MFCKALQSGVTNQRQKQTQSSITKQRQSGVTKQRQRQAERRAMKSFFCTHSLILPLPSPHNSPKCNQVSVLKECSRCPMQNTFSSIILTRAVSSRLECLKNNISWISPRSPVTSVMIVNCGPMRRQVSGQQVWSGYWISPEDADDGWGIVEAFVVSCKAS